MPDIEKFPVTSSNIEAIGYDEKTMTLRMWFKNKNVYDYTDVPPAEFENLQVAQSVGSYFEKNIRGKYSCQKQ